MRKHRISTGVLVFRGARFSVGVLVPIRAPVVGIAGPDPDGGLAQPIPHEGREVAGVSGRAAIQRPADLSNIGMPIAGVTANHSLVIRRPGQHVAPARQYRIGTKAVQRVARVFGGRSGEASYQFVDKPRGLHCRCDHPVRIQPLIGFDVASNEAEEEFQYRNPQLIERELHGILRAKERRQVRNPALMALHEVIQKVPVHRW